MSQFGNVNSNQYYMDGTMGYPGQQQRILNNPIWTYPNNGSTNMSTQGNSIRSTQPVMPSITYGRIVGSEQEIIPNEVPMDGNYGVFATVDKSMVMLKTWGSDGLIHTDYYKLVASEDPSAQNVTEDPYNNILGKLDDIYNYLRAKTSFVDAIEEDRNVYSESSKRPSFSGKKGE